MGSTMDLKGHIKRHSANNIDRSASIRTSSDSPYGSVENKRGSQNTHCPQAEKKPRLEKYDAGSSAIGRRDDDEHLKRWTGPQSSPLEIQMVDGSAETGPKNGRASDLPHARERCGKFPFVKKTSATNQSCCEQCYCYVCETPQSECSTAWGSGDEESDHCNAFDSWDWQQKRDFMRTYGEAASASSYDQAPDLSREYTSLGTVCIPVAACTEHDLVQLPPNHSKFTMDVFEKVTGATKSDPEMAHLRFYTGEEDLPLGKRPKEKELEGVIEELVSVDLCGFLDRNFPVQIRLTVHPSEGSTRLGIIKIKVFVRRSRRSRDDGRETLNLGKVLAYMCKETTPVLQEQVEKLSQVKSDDAVRGIKSVKDLLEKVQSNSMPAETQPDGLGESITLRPYQKQSLRFMLDSEKREGGLHAVVWHKIPGAGTLHEDVYFCPTLLTLKLLRKGEVPPVTTGGFLCEEMGLGKTVEILALTLANPHPNPAELPPPLPRRQKRFPSIPEGGVPSKATLVVCPVSLVGQWMSEAKSKLRGPVSIYKHHGSDRSANPFFLAGHDVVITTYGTLGSDFDALSVANLSEVTKAKRSPLHAVKWWRVVLDESHTVKDPKALQARACAELRSDRRWCCTGTPINTTIFDLHGQFVFLKLDPFDVPATFKRELGTPFEKSALSGYDCYDKSKASLVFLLREIMVRHTKAQTIDGEELLVLPPKTQVDMPVHLSPEERAVYDRAAAAARERFFVLRQLGPDFIGKHFLQIMALLLPLRRICSGGEVSFSRKTAAAPKKGRHAVDRLREAADPGNVPPDSECGICLDVMERPAKTPCDHWFCYECLVGKLDSGPGQHRCPSCYQEVTSADVVEGEGSGTSEELPPSEGSDEGEMDVGAGPAEPPFVAESKLNALLEDLEKVRREDPTAKALIFSQFMGTIDWLKKRLTEAGVTYRYISGEMPLKQRAEAIEKFQQDPPTTVFLLSMRTGAVGITLTSASVVYLLEPVMNPALEDQAVGRAWRMGQQRPVTVKRMFVADSVEERILKVVKNRVEGGAAKPASSADEDLMAAYKSKGKSSRPGTIAGSIRSDKQNLRLSEFEMLFA